jgi:RNA polymerase sigma factor (sigma-70 family)
LNQDAQFFQAASRAVWKVVQGYCRSGWAHLRDDLLQEAWIKILEDRRSFDPTRSNPETWCKMVVSRHLVNVISQLASPVRLTRGAARKVRQERAYNVYNPVEHRDRYDPAAAQEDQSPERLAGRQEGRAIRSGWQDRVRQVVQQVVQGWSGRDRQIATRLMGLDGQPAGTPQEVAQLLGCRLNTVYQAHRRLERELTRNAVAYVLYNQMEDCCDEEEDPGRYDQPASA